MGDSPGGQLRPLLYRRLLSLGGVIGNPSDTCAPEYRRFTGKDRDPVMGEDYFGARYYKNDLGRFYSPDWSASPQPVPYAKLDDPQSLNLYAYALDNPVRNIDKDGHCDTTANAKAATKCDIVSEAQNNSAQPGGNGSTPIVTVSATSSAPGMFVGGLIGELIDPVGGGIPGSFLGSMVGVGANVSYVPSTDSTYAGPTISFTPAPCGGNGVSVSDAIVPAGQNANSIANGTTYSVQFQPTPLTGSTVTKYPGSGPAVAGPSVGTKVPLSFSGARNSDITPAVRSVTSFVNRTINTVESWF